MRFVILVPHPAFVFGRSPGGPRFYGSDVTVAEKNVGPALVGSAEWSAIEANPVEDQQFG